MKYQVELVYRCSVEVELDDSEAEDMTLADIADKAKWDWECAEFCAELSSVDGDIIK